MPQIKSNNLYDARYYTETELSASGGSALIGDHNGHTIHDTFNHILNRGKSFTITVSLDGGLDVSWTSGEIYDEANNLFISTISGSGTLTDNSANYLKWISGTGLTLSTTISDGDEVLVAIFSVYDGVINGYRETSIMSKSVANTRRGLREIIPVRIISGMNVSEDTDVTNALDVTMDAGVFWCCGIEKSTPIEIKSRNTAMIRHFHTAGVWDYDTNAEIDTVNYDNGTQKTVIPTNKWVKALFLYMDGKIGWVYPNAYYNTEAQAIVATLPTVPPGLDTIPKLTAIVYKQGNTDFTNTTWQDVRAGISEVSFTGVDDHGALAGLADNDHPQYFLVDGQSSNIVNGTFDLTTTGLGTFGNLDVDTLNLNGNVISDSTGTISFDNDNLTTTGTLTASGYNDTNWNTAYTHSQIAGGDSVHVSITENTNWDTAYTHSQNNTQAHSDYLLNNADDTTTGTITAGGFLTIGNIKSATLEIENNVDAQLLTLDQNHTTASFIDFQGTSSATVGAGNISTGDGSGAVSAPHVENGGDGWRFAGMVKVEVKGVTRWMPYYNHSSAE